MGTKAASIIIANWNGRNLLEQFLPSVLNALRDCDEVIVVDNGSTDGSVEFLRENFPQVRLIRLPKNYGFSVANNIGVLAARNEVVVLLNNDMRPEEGFLEPLLSHFNDPTVFAVGAKLLHPDGGSVDANRTRLVLSGGLFFFTGEWDTERLLHCHTPEEQVLAQGGGTAFDRAKFLELGGFDPIFSPVHAEDFDLCLRALFRGWRIIFEPRSIVWHLGRQTTRHSPLKFWRLANAHWWLFNFLHAPSLTWLGWQCGTILRQILKEVLSGAPMILRWGLWHLLKRWHQIVLRRWRRRPPRVTQLSALLQQFHHHALLSALPQKLPPLPDEPFALLLMPVTDEEKETVKRVVQEVREQWGLPVAVIARPYQFPTLLKEGIADSVITFWEGMGNSHFSDYKALLRWLRGAPCRVSVIVPQASSIGIGKFEILGALLPYPIWERKMGQFRLLSRRKLLLRLVTRTAVSLTWFALALFWTGTIMSAEIVASLLRGCCPSVERRTHHSR